MVMRRLDGFKKSEDQMQFDDKRFNTLKAYEAANNCSCSSFKRLTTLESTTRFSFFQQMGLLRTSKIQKSGF